MIKFFRHIRRSLINQNQMGKYFKYAIGEILLVVIGILIALQINNWNENRKDFKMSVEFLKGIGDDLRKDVLLVDSVLRLNKESFSVVSSIDSVFHKKHFYQAKKFSQFFGAPDTLDYAHVFYRPTSFRPINGTYNSLIADGKTTLIKNKQLFEKIQRIYNENHQRVASNYEAIKDLEIKLGWAYAVEKKQWTYTDLKRAKREKIFYDVVNFTEEKYWYSQNLLRIKENSQEVISLIENEITND
ncbi:DUF6090 family protein [Winogradskyella alexanderae]|uniref:Uncharacterized protein n=1 Tax=Winogradskyella alexanderae TaxID=2877123 RepID=A0ABS7XUV6_9FLAO|nr:DUF6090 family protein [Winogradskyella alexanderae]MCA0133805.1 hypothetical protein [Winogradskyella alexanderae]